MNCKPGDLAVMVRSEFQRNIGCLFLVVDAHRCDTGEWRCEAVTDCDTSEGRRKAGTIVWALDSRLRPIRNPGEEAQDETLQWLPVPSTEKEAA